jgi:murein DD-endopeptidase MepM/ murein hydrolase activator NlpD
MYIHKRLGIALVLGTILLPLGIAQKALLVIDDHTVVSQRLEEQLDRMKEQYAQFQSGMGRMEMEKIADHADDILVTLHDEARTIRLKIARLERAIERQETRRNAIQNKREHALTRIKDSVGSFFFKGAAYDTPESTSSALTIVNRQIHENKRKISSLRTDLKETHAAKLPIERIRDRTAILLAPAPRPHAAARAGWKIDLDKNRAIVADVQGQVDLLQRKLKRIDAKLRARQERMLIAKGIKTPYKTIASKGFQMPVQGRISSPFMDAGYPAIFGVQHYGVDLAVPQGTAVHAVADGVVFTVKQGGQFGYTYILIGHRDGYSTLYGHLSSVDVPSGAIVSKGEVIGRSGGGKGLPGSGPMTTGSHLHLEMTKDGRHIDPLSILL